MHCRRSGPWLLLCLTLFGVLRLDAAPYPGPQDGANRTWKRIVDGDIEVLGPVPDARLREALEQVRGFRDLFSRIHPGLRLTSPTPTRVVVFPSNSALSRFAPRDARGRRLSVGGFFGTGAALNVMALDGSSTDVLYHEFAHYLISLNLPQLPNWLSEGLAEFYSTFDVDPKKGTMVVGKAPIERVRALRTRNYVPIDRITDISGSQLSRLWRDPEGIGMYYAESWGLVHYLMLGREASEPAAFGRLVQALGQGTAFAPALQSAFGIDVPRLDSELKAYLRARLSYPAVSLDLRTQNAAPSTVAAVSEADARCVQGELLVRSGALDEAVQEIDAALALEPTHLGARIARGRLQTRQGHADDGIATLTQVAASAPTSFAATYYLAASLANEWRYGEALELYSRATQLNAGSSEAWMGLSVSALALGRTSQANAAMVHALAALADPSLYRSRAEAAFGLGADEVAAEDVRHYLEATGWDSENAIYAGLLGAVAHLRVHQAERARDLLDTARAASARFPWTVNVIDFLDGRLTEPQLFDRAKSDGEKTEAHAYAGFKAAIDGRQDQAQTHFEWVVTKGSRTYAEYTMVESELRRSKQTPPR
ncbi:MAG: tetratricopeptide repeat protein [Vicinamibacterales bacterium]